MPNKEVKASEGKTTWGPAQQIAIKTFQGLNKSGSGKTVRDAMISLSPPPPSEAERPELLGSLTTEQQQRTSARVIKKLRLEPEKEKKDDTAECDTPNKMEDKELKFPTVKQRMPKALWSTDEKNLFFEALNEYGKDFDSITAYICAKMKKKGMPDSNLKTKTQVSHFYYRTWHKLAKHVQFDENVKKVAQELYALINYGEMRKKLVSVSEKTCARLGELVLAGSLVVRARGRNVRVRTPMCRALRRLNQITERACGGRVCSRLTVSLRARDAAAWARVQAAAHNPRAAAALPLRTRLAAFLAALQRRWTPSSPLARLPGAVKQDSHTGDYGSLLRRASNDDEDREDLENHLNLATDRIIVQERCASRPALHVGPRRGAAPRLAAVGAAPAAAHNVCFASYLERMGAQVAKAGAKIRTPKRQRKDSATDKDKEVESKKFKAEESESVKLINIDETAIDGIELMANYKNALDDEEKPCTEDEKELKSEETAEEEVETVERDKDIPEKDMLERDKDMSEREKDSFSEMEDDEKYNKSESDNESDHGKEKSTKDTKFKNLKVKFRLRPKKRGRSEYTLVIEKDQDEVKIEEGKDEAKDEEKEVAKDEAKTEESKEDKPDIDLDLAIRQIRKGWSACDAGDLTIGDLYLMFGSRSRIDLDYWWAEPTPPLPRPTTDKDKHMDKKEKADKTPDKESSLEDGERARESDSDIFSPKNNYNQDSNDGMSGDERKSELQTSPEHKASSAAHGATLTLAAKLVNRPAPAVTTPTNRFAEMTDRLKRLLALAGNPHAPRLGCRAPKPDPPAPPRKQPQQKQQLEPPCAPAPLFRHPTPIAPRPDHDSSRTMTLEGLPRWRRGRPRLAARRVVVQRLLPLLPKLPPPSNLIPVKVSPGSPPPPPRILPKPPPTSTSDLSFFYVLSESNGQFFFHDGDRRIPITPLPEVNEVNGDGVPEQEGEVREDPREDRECPDGAAPEPAEPQAQSSSDITSFLPSESMSLSPSRLLREGGEAAAGWLDAAHDFSLSSFLGHLDGRTHADLAMDSQLHSLLAESSVDYVAKFADLAAEVAGDARLPDADDLQ